MMTAQEEATIATAVQWLRAASRLDCLEHIAEDLDLVAEGLTDELAEQLAGRPSTRPQLRLVKSEAS